MKNQKEYMRTAIETITPSGAAMMLAANTANRSLSAWTVTKYAKAMQRGEWRCNGEAIIFDVSGKLANGQHRLHACIEAGMAFDTLVVYGSPVDAFSTLDGGKMRGLSDVLSIQGEKNTVPLASAARTYLLLTIEGRAQFETTTVQVEQIVRNAPALIRWTNEFVKSKPRLFPASIIGVIAQVERIHGQSIAKEFFDKAVLGVGLSEREPELLLREKFINKRLGVAMNARMARAYMIKAANARIANKRMGLLRITVEESYPVLTGIR